MHPDRAGAIGVDYAFDTKVGGRLLRFDARLAWHGELGSRTRNVSGRLADNFTLPTVLSFEDRDGDGVEVGGALTLFFTKSWSASLGYTGDIREDDRVTSRASVSVQTGF